MTIRFHEYWNALVRRVEKFDVEVHNRAIMLFTEPNYIFGQ